MISRDDLKIMTKEELIENMPIYVSQWEDPISVTLKNFAIKTNNPKKLNRLSNHPEQMIRRRVAENMFTKRDVIEKLINDKYYKVRAGVASRSDIRKEDIEKLKFEGKVILSVLVQNNSVDLNTVKEIIKRNMKKHKEEMCYSFIHRCTRGGSYDDEILLFIFEETRHEQHYVGVATTVYKFLSEKEKSIISL